MRFAVPPLVALLFGLLVALVGCEATPSADEPPLRLIRQAGAVEGPWVIPPAIKAVGESQYVAYDSAPAWNGGANCSGNLTPGARELHDFLETYVRNTCSVGGYNCREIVGSPGSMSLHGTGRALDVYVQTVGADDCGDRGPADNDLGDPIAHWLIENAEYIGVQYIIWDWWSWRADRSGAKDRLYCGGDSGRCHSHDNHLHVELTIEAGNRETGWFLDGCGDGSCGGIETTPCAVLPADGGVLEETGPCFAAYGPSAYWRSVDGAGHDGSLLWTNAFESDSPSNWARWTVHVEEAGEYAVEVYLEDEFAVWPETRYAVMASGTEHIVELDQSAYSGWAELGSFDFAADGVQWVAVYDDYVGDVPDDQHIATDALRLARVWPG